MKTLTLLGLAAFAVACSDFEASTYSSAGESSERGYFGQKSITVTLAPGTTGDQILPITVLRQNNKGEAAVSVAVESEGVFTAPAEVVFADGEYSATLELTAHAVEEFAPGTTYEATVKLINLEEEPVVGGIEVKGQYESLAVSCALELNWIPAYEYKDMTKLLQRKPEGTADADWYVCEGGAPRPMLADVTYSAFMSSLFDESEIVDGDLELERAEGTNMFRVMNVFGGVPFVFTIDSKEEHKIQGYHLVSVGWQGVGFDLGAANGEMQIGDVSILYGFNMAAFAKYPCIWNGRNDLQLTLFESCAKADAAAGYGFGFGVYRIKMKGASL